MVGMTAKGMNMEVGNIELDDEILEKATECDRDFSCLDCKRREMCKAEYSVNNEILFVKGDGPLYCSYRMFYGDGEICNCPVRMEIYKKYNI